MNMKKTFKDVERDYVKTEWFPTKIPYKKFNDQVTIDLKRIIDGVLEELDIGNYKTRKIELKIPIDPDDNVTDHSMSLIVDKKRFTLRLNDLEIIPSKQQKIDFDNTHPHRWKIPQWIKFINHLFYKYYGIRATDLAAETSQRKARLNSRVKSLIERIITIKSFDTDYQSVVDYLNWVFHEKNKKLSLTIALICSESLVQEWAIEMAKKVNDGCKPKKKRKWD